MWTIAGVPKTHQTKSSTTWDRLGSQTARRKIRARDAKLRDNRKTPVWPSYTASTCSKEAPAPANLVRLDDIQARPATAIEEREEVGTRD